MTGSPPPGTTSDARERRWMRRALVLARRGWGTTAPNPMVGAVLVRDGRIVGEGYHERFGEAHAEVNAIASAGSDVRGADLFVTLEPCNHHGKTPPCVDAIIAAGIRRVVAATEDPFAASGGGAARLRAAGVTVEFGLEADATRELNAPFYFSAGAVERPWVTVKLALSLDGAIADATRTLRWLTNEPSRKYVHRLRAQSDAIAVGIGTALADDPRLTVRSGRRPRLAPLRVVFDREARLPVRSRLAKSASRIPTAVLAGQPDGGRVFALKAKGVEVLYAGDTNEALQVLWQRGVRSLLVEGGAGLTSGLLAAGMVDRLIIFQSPVLLGSGSLPAFMGVSPIERLRVIERREFGDDLMTIHAINELPPTS